MKQRAAINDGNAKRADAAETRWKRFVDAGPPPAPVTDQQIQVRIRGGDSARIVVAAARRRDRRARAAVRGRDPLRRAGRADRAERLRQDAPDPPARRRGDPAQRRAADRQPRLGRAVHAAQLARRPRGPRRARRRAASGSGRARAVDARARPLPDPGRREPARPTRSPAARRRGWRSSASSSRATTCCCSTSRPTTSTSTPSEALEAALESFVGTVVAVSHDRAFLRRLDRFLLLAHDGSVYALPDTESALEALAAPEHVAGARLAKRLTPA